MITVRDLSWQYEPLVDGGKPGIGGVGGGRKAGG